MAKAGTAYIDFEGRYDTLNRQTSRAMASIDSQASSLSRSVGSSLASIGSSLATGFTVAAGAATAIGANLVRTGVEYNTLNQRARAAMETVLGTQEASADMMRQVTEFARSSPFPRQAFIEATQQMLAFGFAAEDVVPTLSAIEDAVAASGGGAQQLKEVTFILSQIQASGKITATDLMQLGQRGIDAAGLIGQSLGMTGQQVRDNITAGALDAGTAIDALTQGMETSFGGAAENVKNTWIGATDRIQGALRDIGSALVEPFISVEGGGLAVEWANTVADALRGLETAIKPVIDALVDRLMPFFERVQPYLEQFATWAKNIDPAGVIGIVDKLAEFLPMISGLAGALGATGLSNIAGMFGPLGSLLGPLASINPAVAAIGGLVLASEEGRAALSGLVDAFMPLVDLLGGMIEPLLEAIQPVLTTAVALIGEFASEFITALTPALEEFLPPLLDVVTVLGDSLLQVLEAIRPVLPVLAEAMAGALGEALKAMVPILEELTPLIVLLADVLAIVLPVVIQLQAWFWKLYGVFVGAIWRTIAVLFERAADALRPLLEGLRALFSGDFSEAFAKFKEFGQNLVESIVTGMVGIPVKIGQAIWNGLSSAFSWLVGQLGPLLGRIITAIGAWVTGTAVPAIAGFMARLVPTMLGWLLDSIVQTPLLLLRLVNNILNFLVEATVWLAQHFAMWGIEALRWIWNTVAALPGQLASLWNTIWGWITQVPGWIATAVTQWVPAFFSWVGGVLADLPGQLASIWNTIWGWLTSLPGLIADAAVGIYNAFKDIGSSIITAIGEGLMSAVSWVGSVADAIWDAVWELLKDHVFKPIIEFEVDLPGPLPTVAPFEGLSNIIELATGGLIRKPQLALIGEAGPELVLPLNDPTRMAELLAQYVPGFTTAQAGLAAGGVGLTGGGQGTPLDNEGLRTWAAEAAAILVQLGLAIDAWVASTVTALRTWAYVAVPSQTLPGMALWSAQMVSIFTSLSNQVQTVMAGMAAQVATILTTAGATWRTIADLAGYNVVLVITQRLYAGIAQIAAIVQQYAQQLTAGLNPILTAVGQQAIQLANGGVVAYANGGFERHVAQIAPAGAMRIWAEPETGGEAYIPLAAGKRRRSKAIAEAVVRHFGGDVSWYAGGGVTGPTQGLNPEFLSRVQRWAQAVGEVYRITSGYRSIAQQEVLYARYLAGTGNLAARPGSSNHNFGLAIDGSHWASRNPGAFGLVYSVRGEPWHVEPVEARAWRGQAGAWTDNPEGMGIDRASLPAPPGMPWQGYIATVAAAYMAYVYQKAMEWASANLAGVGGDVGDVSGTGMGGSNRSIGQQMAAARGWTGNQWNALDQLWTKESGWNERADNPTSSAYGIPQALPGSKMASHGADWRTNPATQIAWGLDYIAGRYGSPAAAWAHSQARNWYGRGGVVFVHSGTFDRGGVLKPGVNLVNNATGADERLVPAGQRGSAVSIENAHFHEGVDYDMFLRKTAFMVQAGRL